ncbi:MAG: cysteine peptidase family C39 domain-containing protein [Candidatus Pacearchaeota archaeon]
MKKILKFPELRQTFVWDCGPNAMQGVLHYYGIDVREDSLIRIAGTQKRYGTYISGLKKVVRRFNLKQKSGKMTVDDIKRWINKKVPVIVSLQAWSDEKDVDWEKTWHHGHFVVCIGYSKTRLYFEDPSSGRRTFLPYNEFLQRWHDTDAGNKKIINWGMAVYRMHNPKKVKKTSLIDYWKKKLAFNINKVVKMG